MWDSRGANPEIPTIRTIPSPIICQTPRPRIFHENMRLVLYASTENCCPVKFKQSARNLEYKTNYWSSEKLLNSYDRRTTRDSKE